MSARDATGFTCARCTALRYGWCRCHLDGSPFARALDLAAQRGQMAAMHPPAVDTGDSTLNSIVNPKGGRK